MSDTAIHTAGRVTLRPNRFGLIFGAVLAAMLAGSVNYHSNLGLLLTFVLGAMAAVAAVQIRRGLRAITVVAAQMEPVFAGQTAQVRLTFGAALPALVNLGFEQNPAVRVAAVAGRNRTTLAMATRTRGQAPPGVLAITTDQPLGLWRGTLRLAVSVAGLVYPMPLAGGSPQAADEVAGQPAGAGRPAGPAVGGVEDFKGLRAYQPGDRLQHISWKGFSKGRGLVTKQFGGPTGASAVLDLEALAGGTLEQRLCRLCHGVIDLHRRQAAYGLKLPGTLIAPGTGPAHRHRCLAALALYREPAIRRPDHA